MSPEGHSARVILVLVGCVCVVCAFSAEGGGTLVSSRGYEYGTGSGGWAWEKPDYRYPPGWVSRQDSEDEEKDKGDGGLYGLFGLMGLFGILPLVLPLILLVLLLPLALLLFIPIPVIQPPATGRGRSFDFSGNSTAFQSDDGMWMGRGTDMTRILSGIAKDYSSSIQKISSGSFLSGCLERASCTMARLANTYSPSNFPMNRLTGFIGSSRNRIMRRIKQGMMTSGKNCKVYKCDLVT